MISDGNEVWPVLELDHFLQPRILSIGRRQHRGFDLKGRPVKQFANGAIICFMFE
jgi:hypothetical protein